MNTVTVSPYRVDMAREYLQRLERDAASGGQYSDLAEAQRSAVRHVLLTLDLLEDAESLEG